MRCVPLALATLVATSGLAFTTFKDPGSDDAVRWQQGSVEISLQQDGSDDISDGSDLDAMRQALSTWRQAVSGQLQIDEGPMSSSRAHGNDGVNRMTFLESSWPSGADTALGTTLPLIVGGHFVDVDILLNGNDGPWVVDGDPEGIDLRSVATHELGHLIGLWHAARADSVMYTGARGGTTFRRGLAVDDLRGADFVTQGTLACGDDTDCPLLVAMPGWGGQHRRLSCQSGSCQPGTVGYGGACLSGDHCDSGHCLRDPWTSNSLDPGACTRGCTLGASDCPNGDLCKDIGGTAYCVPARDCLDDDDCGGGSNDHCLFDFDGRYRCRRLCMQDAHCEVGQRCIDLGYGAGVCHDPGATANGGSCLSPLECAGLACRGDSNELRCQTAPSTVDGGGVPDVPQVGTDAGASNEAGARDAGLPDTADYAGLPPEKKGCDCRSDATSAASPLALALLLVGALRRRRGLT